MKSSLKPLGTFVNSLSESGRAVVSESHLAPVTVNRLSLDDAERLLALLSEFGMAASVVDDAEQELDANSLNSGIAPFGVTFTKHAVDDGIGFISTLAFQGWLKSPHVQPATKIAVADATVALTTEAFIVAPWDWAGLFEPKSDRKSPRSLVSVRGNSMQFPGSICPYLLYSAEEVPTSDSVFVAWSDVAAQMCVAALVNEVDGGEGKVRFAGPPRLEFDVLTGPDGRRLVEGIFPLLQAVVRWVYDVDREAELKHRLFGQEFARLAQKGVNLADELVRVIDSAFDGAKIAYGFSVQEMSRDALKGLSDLRKAVADETQKSSEAARQLALNAAGAEFYALGLLAARITSTVEPFIIDCMAALGVFYVLCVLYINLRYLNHQDEQRKVWRAKLYRYLTEDDYRVMVTVPVSHSERLLKWMILAIAVLSLVTFSAVWVVNHGF